MNRLDPSEWFQITVDDREYLRALLERESHRHEAGSDGQRRATEMFVQLTVEVRG